MDSLHDSRFFFEVPPFEELQDPNSSPRREEVGRHTLRVPGGLLPAFFYRASFEMFTQQILMFVEKPQVHTCSSFLKLPPTFSQLLPASPTFSFQELSENFPRTDPWVPGERFPSALGPRGEGES